MDAYLQTSLAGVPARLNVAYYHDDYSNIQRNFTGILPTGAPVIYTANVAAARLSGFEAELLVRPSPALTMSLNFSHNVTGYTNWRGADPLNVAPAGTILDLSRNPFPNAPRNKISANVTYDLYSSDSFGTVTVGAQAYAQSREWFSANSQRFLDVYGQNLYEAFSQHSYATFNARLDWTDIQGIRGLGGGLFVRNLGQAIYTTSGIVQLNQVGSATKSYAEPRTYGLNLSYHF